MLTLTGDQLQAIGEAMWQKLVSDERFTHEKSVRRLEVVKPFDIMVPEVLYNRGFLSNHVDFKSIMFVRSFITRYLLDAGFNNKIAKLSITDTPLDEEIRVLNGNFEFLIELLNFMASPHGYMQLLEGGFTEDTLLARLKLTEAEISRIKSGMTMLELIQEIPFALFGGIPMFQVACNYVLNRRKPLLGGLL